MFCFCNPCKVVVLQRNCGKWNEILHMMLVNVGTYVTQFIYYSVAFKTD